MPPKSYVYAPSTVGLAEKIAGGCGVAPLAVAKTINGDTQVIMPDELDPSVKGFLDDYMNTRNLDPSGKTMLIHATTTLVGLPRDLGPAWTDLGGVVTNPSFFVPNVAAVIGLVTGNIRTNGLGAKLRVVEDVVGAENILIEQPLPDTGGAWQVFQFLTGNPSANPIEKTYTLRGDAAGLATAEARFMSLALVEILQTT